MHANTETITVGGAIAHFLHVCGVKTAFGVISIHNMPILDAFNAQQHIRFIPARGEAGATNMADAYARTTNSLGVSVTSTGTAAGNAAGAMVEALTAGTPILHLTGQIEAEYVDKNMAYIHEAPEQLMMLKAVSKAAFRIRSPETALGIIKQAVQAALTAPTGPVSVEIPIDIQAAIIPFPSNFEPLPIQYPPAPPQSVAELANRLSKAKRPLIWAGGGARKAQVQIQKLLSMGFGLVTSTQGRGVVPEDDNRSVGAFTIQKSVQDLYNSCDAILVVGSRLRSNETLKYELALPKNLYRIDIDSSADGRGYRSDYFVQGDAATTLEALINVLDGKMQIDANLHQDVEQAYKKAVQQVEQGMGPYPSMVQAIQQHCGTNFNWVRDVTLSNSIWGNRLLKIISPTSGVHAMGGGIGQGLAMGIGAAIGVQATQSKRKTLCLAGDGGFILNLGELATAVQEQTDLVVLLMNDQGYGVIKNIQDTTYGKRRCYVDLHTPNYTQLCASLGWSHTRVTDLKDFGTVFQKALQHNGPIMIEIDMLSIGGFTTVFAGPPVNQSK